MTVHSVETGIPTDTFEMRLAIARFHAGNLSAKEAALRVGVSGQAWRNWEAGKSPGAHKPAMLRYIAQQLGVDEDWLRNGGPLKANTPGPNGTEGGESGRRDSNSQHSAWNVEELAQVIRPDFAGHLIGVAA